MVGLGCYLFVDYGSESSYDDICYVSIRLGSELRGPLYCLVWSNIYLVSLFSFGRDYMGVQIP